MTFQKEQKCLEGFKIVQMLEQEDIGLSRALLVVAIQS
jgi:hypothetical protein